MALFGGGDIDLRQAGFTAEGCNLHLTAIFGGIDVIVPDDIQVITSGIPIFGAIEDKSTHSETKPIRSTVKCHCTVIFGGIEIK